MKNIKQYLLEFVWEGDNISDFERWLYEQDSTEFENLVGEENYIELISYDFRKKAIRQVKELIKSNLGDRLIKEFEIEFRKREIAIKGICKKNETLDYHGTEIRNWDVEIGKTYEFLIINSGLKTGNHSSLVNYVDRDYFFRPSGFIPLELFEIDLNNISELYHKVENKKNETTIEPVDFSKKKYKRRRYSFWEDFYDDDEKAVNTYYGTLEKLGIKNVW